MIALIPRAASLDDLLTRWTRPNHQPFKGGLIDWEAYTANPYSLDCMDAHGQLLVSFGGWSPSELKNTSAFDADRALARLMNISQPHAAAIRTVGDGHLWPLSGFVKDARPYFPNGERLLSFWRVLDQMEHRQFGAAAAIVRSSQWRDGMQAARLAAGTASTPATTVANHATRQGWLPRPWDAVRDAEGAANEIIGAELLRPTSKWPLLKLFGFDSPEDLPALPSNYGELRP